jgi:hypothetical protein
MAANKGKQFEYAFMNIANSYLRNRKEKYPVDKDVMDIASKIIDQIKPANSQLDAFFKSFTLLGGSTPEPKTDLLFVKSGVTYKCSLKWGSTYQLASAGIDSTVKYFESVLQTVAKTTDKKTIIELQNLFAELGELSVGKKVDEASVIQGILNEKIRGDKGLELRLQKILGSRSNTVASEKYIKFKKELVRESLTGALTFGKKSDSTANYIISSDKGLYPIDEKLVTEVANKTYIGIRAKGRSKDKSGTRLQEITVRLEPKA